MQSEDKGEHININLDSKCDEKDDVISDECCWQKKKKITLQEFSDIFHDTECEQDKCWKRIQI